MSSHHDDDLETYEVGYRKPPKHRRWRPGQSGNPSGRPRKKKASSFGVLLEGALTESLELPEGERTTVITRKRLMVRRLVENAAKGRKRALAKLFKLQQAVEEKKMDDTTVHVVLTEDEARATGRKVKGITRPVWANEFCNKDEPEEVVSAAELRTRRAGRVGFKTAVQEALTFAALIELELGRKVDVTVRGRPRRLTMREVIVTQFANAAAKGDEGAIDLLLKFSERREPETAKSHRIMIVPDDWSE